MFSMCDLLELDALKDYFDRIRYSVFHIYSSKGEMPSFSLCFGADYTSHHILFAIPWLI